MTKINEGKIYEILNDDRHKLYGNEETVHSGSYFLGIRNKNTGAIHVTSKSASESTDDIWMYDGSEVTRTVSKSRTIRFYDEYIVTDKPRFRNAIRKARVNMAQWEVITIDWDFAQWTRTKDGHFSSNISKYVDDSQVTVLCDLPEYEHSNGIRPSEVIKTESPVSNEAEVIV